MSGRRYDQCDDTCTVDCGHCKGQGRPNVADQAYRIRALESVLADRERELLDLKGPCSRSTCPLHYAHAGPCAPVKAATDA